MNKTVYPIHFEDRDGHEFERLVFAYVFNLKEWDSLEWLGQKGGDGGRDIWGTRDGETYCYQCANYRKLPFAKITNDIDSVVTKNTIPDNFIVVCGGNISPVLRNKITSYAQGKPIKRVDTWSGVEFEERMRKDTPHILERFVKGVEFPDSAAELIEYVKSFRLSDDKHIIDALLECFDRPAFTTPFRDESSMGDFEKALKDTIEVLNTGMHRLRDGTDIRKIPSRHSITDKVLKTKLATITNMVIGLKDSFIALRRSGDIIHCGCSEVDCPCDRL